MKLNKRVNGEHLRRTVRRVIGSHSPLYRAGSALLDFVSVAQEREHWNMGHTPATQGVPFPSLPAVPITFRGVRHPFLVRPGTEDVEMIISTIIREEYGQFQPAVDPEWMIDAGTYIGDTSALFPVAVSPTEIGRFGAKSSRLRDGSPESGSLWRPSHIAPKGAVDK